MVGHTNTGKTSLIRTLARDAAFGEVSDRAGVTRDVAGHALTLAGGGGERAIELYDTPGLEDSVALLDRLDRLRDELAAADSGSTKPDDHAVLITFLAGPEAAEGGEFGQEAKALRQLLACDGALLVLDARERVLARHRDEVEILGRCARPIVPVLNFVASPGAQPALWREQLARVNMHAVAEFDTVVVDAAGEVRLFEKVRSLLDGFRPTLDAMVAGLRRRREELLDGSSRLVAEMLVDAAAAAVPVASREPTKAEAERVLESLRTLIRRRERRCTDDLLALHRFRPEDVADDEPALGDGRWGMDLFSPEVLKSYGVRAGGGAAAGALAGATVDLALHGMSLGAGAVIGALLGAAAGTRPETARRALRRLRGQTDLHVDDATLRLLVARQVELVRALGARGHASVQPLRLGAGKGEPSAGGDAGAVDAVLRELAGAGAHPEWSSLNDVPLASDAVPRDRAVASVAERIRPLLMTERV